MWRKSLTCLFAAMDPGQLATLHQLPACPVLSRSCLRRRKCQVNVGDRLGRRQIRAQAKVGDMIDRR